MDFAVDAGGLSRRLATSEPWRRWKPRSKAHDGGLPNSTAIRSLITDRASQLGRINLAAETADVVCGASARVSRVAAAASPEAAQSAGHSSRGRRGELAPAI